MTTIILVAIGILIAVLAALFVVFYGGSAYNEGYVRGEAARLVTESAQVEDAYDLYLRQEDHTPGLGNSAQAMPAMISDHYLTHVPVGAHAGGVISPWTISYEKKMIRSDAGPQKDASGKDTQAMAICVEARRQLKFPTPSNVLQCTDPALGFLDPCCIE